MRDLMPQVLALGLSMPSRLVMMSTPDLQEFRECRHHRVTKLRIHISSGRESRLFGVDPRAGIVDTSFLRMAGRLERLSARNNGVTLGDDGGLETITLS